MNYSAKTVKQGKTTSRCSTHSIRRFKKYLGTINWKKNDLVYLRVNYGFRLDNFGNMSNFINEGEYNNPEDFWLAFNAFMEKD